MIFERQYNLILQMDNFSNTSYSAEHAVVKTVAKEGIVSKCDRSPRLMETAFSTLPPQMCPMCRKIQPSGTRCCDD